MLETYRQLDTYKKLVTTCEITFETFQNSCLKHVRHFLEICGDLLETCLRLHRDTFYTFCFKSMRHLCDIRLQIDKNKLKT